MTTLKVGLSHAEWGVWLRWMVANIAGWVIVCIGFLCIGLPLALAIGVVLPSALGWGPSAGFVTVPIGFLVVVLLAGITVGPAVGIMQYLVLRRHISLSGWWVVASTAGWFIFIVLGVSGVLLMGLLTDFTMPSITGEATDWISQVFKLVIAVVLATIPGITLGIMQWIVLRRQVFRAGWWVLASTASWAVGALPSVLLGVLGPLACLSPFLYVLTPSAITGLALIWLLRQPVPGRGRLEIATTGIDP